jgi:hypothetical protein
LEQQERALDRRIATYSDLYRAVAASYRAVGGDGRKPDSKAAAQHEQDVLRLISLVHLIGSAEVRAAATKVIRTINELRETGATLTSGHPDFGDADTRASAALGGLISAMRAEVAADKRPMIVGKPPR